MSNSIEEFHQQLLSEIRNEVEQSHIGADEAFFEIMAAKLVSNGEMDTSDRAYFEGSSSNKTIRIDGSGGDPRDSDDILSLIICDFHNDEIPVSLNAADAKKLFGHLTNFVSAISKAEFRAGMQKGSSGAGLADLIANTWKSIQKIKLILITNGVYNARTDAVAGGTLGEIPVTYNVWDLSRFHRFESSGQAKEALQIDFKADYGSAVPALAASQSQGELESYLMVIPGRQLADIYDDWGARLLESNVRSFLQARGKVNQGIRDTIKSKPQMFFSYNNGISATADKVEVEHTSNGLEIVSATNLQIVNGGQTTASLHAAKRLSPASLEQVYVQMKLTIVPSERSEEIVPRISEYANSQNKVNAADFFSNHAFHIRTEEFSRKILAPAPEGTNLETQWFYERAAGQYNVERSKRSDAEKRRFDIRFPKSQFFTKTDLAKVEYSFEGKPEIVSKGAQKNFAQFAKETGELWSKEESRFDEVWYRRMIGKLIMFRYLEKAIPKQPWYPGDFRANIVTYTLAKLAYDAEELNQTINLDNVWKNQKVSKDLENALLKAAEAAADVIVNPLPGMKNSTEWAKKQACWSILQRRKVDYQSALDKVTIDPKEAKSVVTDNKKNAVITFGIEAQTKVLGLGAEYWTQLRLWGVENRKLSDTEIGILQACEAIARKLPTEKQCIAALGILDKCKTHGYLADDDAPAPTRLTGWQRPH